MTQAKIASTAYLIAEPVRAVMLIALSDGGSLSAGALAEAAGVTPQTASSHLAKLLTGGLLTVDIRGRHRFYRLAGADVAHALESLAAISPQASAWRSLPNPAAQALRFARCCFDHLAGELGVAVTHGLLARGFMVEGDGPDYAVTLSGITWLHSLGLNTDELAAVDTGLAKRCLDWTEREHHLAGPLGAFVLTSFVELGWLRRSTGSRAVVVTPPGWRALRDHLGVQLPGLGQGRAAES